MIYIIIYIYIPRRIRIRMVVQTTSWALWLFICFFFCILQGPFVSEAGNVSWRDTEDLAPTRHLKPFNSLYIFGEKVETLSKALKPLFCLRIPFSLQQQIMFKMKIKAQDYLDCFVAFDLAAWQDNICWQLNERVLFLFLHFIHDCMPLNHHKR